MTDNTRLKNCVSFVMLFRRSEIFLIGYIRNKRQAISKTDRVIIQQLYIFIKVCNVKITQFTIVIQRP